MLIGLCAKMMNNKDKAFKIVTIVILLALVVITWVMNRKLQENTETIEQQQREMTNNHYHINSSLSDLYDNIEEQNSNIESWKVEVQEVNIKTLKGNLKFTIELKKYTKDSKVRVSVGKYSAELELKNDKFVGVLNTPIDEIYNQFSITMENGDMLETEVIEAESEIDWETYLIDGIWSSMYSEEYSELRSENGKHAIKGFTIEFCPKDIDSVLKTPKVFIASGDKVLYEKEMTYSKRDGIYKLTLDVTYECDADSDIQIYSEYTDKSGLKFKVVYNEIEELDEVDEEGEVEIFTPGLIKFKYMDDSHTDITYADDSDDDDN